MPGWNFGDNGYLGGNGLDGRRVMPRRLAATLAADVVGYSRLMGVDETGTLELGKDADVVVVNGDPLADIRALHSVDTIVKQGSVVRRNGQTLI